MSLIAATYSVGTVFTGAFAFGLGFDTLATKLWDNHNAGVSTKVMDTQTSREHMLGVENTRLP
jgi:ABC-type spermidine/putrescine transport system permease subunit II